MEISRIFVRNHADDPSLAPPEKTVFSVMVEGDYGFWSRIPYQSEAYRREKDRAGDRVVGMIDRVFPGIREKVEVIDVATPSTFIRYTGNWQGSYQGWLWTRETTSRRLPRTLPGIANFYMAGHWVAPGGGLPGAAISAREAVQMMCKQDGRKFTTIRV